MAQPWFKFDATDWLGDIHLRGVSPAARGVWIDLLCLMHQSEERGVLITNGVPWTFEEVVRSVAYGSRSVRQACSELVTKRVMKQREDGAFYSKRMVKDEAQSLIDQENGKRGGNPKLREGVNPPLGKGVKARPKNSEQRTKSIPPPTSSGGVVSQKAEAAEEVRTGDLFQPGDSKGVSDPYWLIHKYLRELGMCDTGEALENLRIQGVSQTEALRAIGYWKDQPEDTWDNRLGALHHKLSNMVEGEVATAGWPLASPAHQERLKREAAKKQADEARASEVQGRIHRQEENTRREAGDAELESAFGKALDAMDPAEREAMAVQVFGVNHPAMGMYRQKGPVGKLVRPALLKALANRPTGPPAQETSERSGFS